jgi:hypothetical protein
VIDDHQPDSLNNSATAQALLPSLTICILSFHSRESSILCQEAGTSSGSHRPTGSRLQALTMMQTTPNFAMTVM